MNIVLWILQVLLALHTAMGAVWKFTNSEQSVPSLSALPHGVWLGLSVVELGCSLALLIPIVHRPWALLAPMGAAVVAAEMLMFIVLYLRSGLSGYGEVTYWGVVALLSAVIVYGRWAVVSA